MTISTEVRKAGPFIGNDSASVFPFAFKVFKAADLIVVRRQDNIGEETALVLDSDYHVTLNSNQDTTPGGVVTLVAGALASGFTLVVSSELPYLQPTDLTNQGGFYPKVITNAMDRLTIFCQQLAEITGRTLKLPITAPTNISAEIPLPNPSELIAWDETGTRLTTVSPQSLVTSIAYGSATADLFAGDGVTTTFPLSTNPASVNNLDVSVGGFSQRPVQGGIGDYSWNGGASITFASPPPAPSIPGDKNVLVRYMQAIPVSDSEALHAQTREALRRSYAEAGYNLVEGSFETGGTLTSTSDVLLLESAGTAYAWTGAYPVGGYDVAPGIDPTIVPGFVLKSLVVLRNELLSGALKMRNGKFSLRDHISVLDYSASSDVTTAEFIAAVTAANAENVKLICPGFATITLAGSTNINIQTDVDFNGATIDLSGYSGRLTFLRRKTKTDNGAGSAVLTALQSEASISGNYFSGWNGVDAVTDAYVIIETSAPFYTYRSTPVTRFELNRHSRYGFVESSLVKPLDTATLTNVQVFPMEDRITTVENIRFYIGDNDAAYENVRIESSRIVARNWLFIMDYAFANSVVNPTLFSVTRSCDVTLDNIDYQWANRATATTGYTYDFAIESSYDVKVRNMRAVGDGWGATGSNSSSRITFENSKLSRVDFHQPFRDYLKLLNCEIGQWGVLVTALGDLEIIGGSMMIDDFAYVNNQGFIRSREDTGGFCDGDLTVKDVTLLNFKAGTTRLAQHLYSAVGGVTAGSPINPVFWNSITVDNVRVKGIGAVNMLPGIVAGSGIKYPFNISVLNSSEGDIDAIEGDFQNIQPHFSLVTASPGSAGYNNPNAQINISNSAIRYLKLREIGTQKFSFGINVDGLKVRKSSPISCVNALAVGGVLNFNASRVEGFNFFYASTQIDKKLNVSFSNGTVRHTANETGNVVNGNTADVNLVISNSGLNADNTSRLNTALQATLKNNTYSVANGPAGEHDVTGDFTVLAAQPLGSAALSTRSDYYLVCGYTANNTDRYIPFVMPAAGKSVFLNITATTTCVLSRSADGATLTGTSTGTAIEFARRVVVR